MAKQKIKRKELLKGPDEFLTFSDRAINYVQGHAKYFEYAGMAVAAAALVYLGVNTYLNYVNKQGQGAYNAAYAEIGEDNKTDVEKTETLFKKVAEEYSLSRVSRLVPPQVGYLKYRENKYDEAVGYYETFRDELPEKSPYRILSQLALAAVYEEKGELDRAIGILNDLKSKPDDAFMEQTLVSLARVYRLSKQDDKAKDVYREFIERFKTSPFLSVAKSYLNEPPS